MKGKEDLERKVFWGRVLVVGAEGAPENPDSCLSKGEGWRLVLASLKDPSVSQGRQEG